MFEPTAICRRLLIAGLLLAMAPWSSAQMKDFGNRREGTTMHVDALEDLAIVAVHRDFEPFPRNANLSVRFFLPAQPGSPAPDVDVEGIELQDSFHYLMESKQPALKAGAWKSATRRDVTLLRYPERINLADCCRTRMEIFQPALWGFLHRR
jgi:hypothetical protein